MKKKYQIKKDSWYNLDYQKAEKSLEGENKFLNEFSIPTFGQGVWAVFFNKNPNREKGHKSYPMIGMSQDRWYINAMDKEEIEPYRWRDAIYCKNCQDIIYSIHRHHFHICTCDKVAIDGGPCYTKINGNPADYEYAQIDLLTDKVVFAKKEKKNGLRRKKTKKST